MTTTMDFPRLTRVAAELVNRRRRQRVLDYETPQPPVTWRQRASLWREHWDAAGDWRWLLAAVAGAGLIVAGPLFLGRTWGTWVGLTGSAILWFSIVRLRGGASW